MSYERWVGKGKVAQFVPMLNRQNYYFFIFVRWLKKTI